MSIKCQKHNLVICSSGNECELKSLHRSGTSCHECEYPSVEAKLLIDIGMMAALHFSNEQQVPNDERRLRIAIREYWSFKVNEIARRAGAEYREKRQSKL
jgi:hypothetical protein